ncbi:telomere length regulation protein TEL2 homolog isoform X1 [Zeugodacus cucurbitae]|uniref:telomere length regulation protein TEL2 homolog isoform X1 n=1 Tax=Zeugodacus cucurbitae TaxID=28588 RepID=UPI0023D9055F|nr:telomere length regulation protein TEL2 homolog isoform X1 [Zeugodacus cucurbitae]
MVDKFISMWKVRELADKVTNVVMNYTEIEGKVREATNDDPWGPTGPLMQELAHATFSYESFPEVMSMLWKRMLQDNKSNWRRTYKSLLLLNYLVRNGSERVVTSSREHIYDLRSLENYTFTDEGGKDQGINVRHKVRELIDFIQDDERLREERKKAKKNKDKYIGMSSDAMGMRSMSAQSGGYNDWRAQRSDFGDNWYSDARGGDRYEDEDAQYEGEREFSDSDSPSPRRANRYNDRSSPAEFGIEAKPNSINMNIRPKSALNSTPSSITRQPTAKPVVGSKKIDMGAAANFGKMSPTAAGIHSPTHRDTPISGGDDLIGSNGNNEGSIASIDNNNLMGAQQKSGGGSNNNNLLDDIFKTCPAPNDKTLTSAAITSDDLDDFDPRAIESKQSQEFGDFTSAFDSGALPELPSTNIAAASTDEFADFSAFQGSSGANTLSGLDNSLLTTATPANDSFDLFSGTSATIAETVAPGASTTTDLLAGLGDLSIHQSMPMVEDGIEETPRIKPIPVNIKKTLKQAISIFKSIPKITCAADATKIAKTIENLFSSGVLPGYCTPEKIIGFDKDALDWSEIASYEYTEILMSLIRLFSREWPGIRSSAEDVQVFNLFKVDYSFAFIYETFYSLNKYLSILDEDGATTIVYVLSELMNDSQLLPLAILHICRAQSVLTPELAELGLNTLPTSKIEEINTDVTEFLQIIISLPNRVANKLGQNLPDAFIPHNYAHKLLQHLLCALNFIFKCENISCFNLEFCSRLLSRIIRNFCNFEQGDSKLYEFLKIMDEFAKLSGPRIVIQKMFNALDPNAIHKAGFAVLLTAPDVDAYRVLGDAAANSANWQFCFTHTLAIQHGPNSEQALCALVRYLALNDPKLVQIVFQQLLSVWSKRTTLLRLSEKEHLTIGKLLIATAKQLFDEQQDKKFHMLNDNEYKRYLHDILRFHLESADVVQRHIGMKVVELIFNYMEDQQTKEEDRLHFEYADVLKLSRGRLITELDSIANNYKQPKKDDAVGAEFNLIRLTNLLESFIKETTEMSKNVTPKSSSPPVDVPLNCVEISTKSMELDSDDDEEEYKPYNMSNDTSIVAEKRPKFLLDLLHTLSTKPDNYEVFEAAISAAEQLIRSQLSQQDSSLAIDILRLFVPLEMHYYYEDFERMKFKCGVAVCVSVPGSSAKYLCREFHTDNTCYNATLRILMLQIMAAAAKELSGITGEAENNTEAPLLPTPAKHPRKFHFENEHESRLLAAQRIIRQRLKEKTKRFHSRQKGLDSKSAKPNRFHKVAGTFFFSLVRGSRTQQMLYVKPDHIAHDIDTLLLVNFLHTLTVFVLSATNCPVLPVITREVFDLCTFVRFSVEARVRLATLELIGATLVTTPAYILMTQFGERIAEIQQWLEDLVKSPLFGGETSEECRDIANQILGTCYKLYSAEQIE